MNSSPSVSQIRGMIEERIHRNGEDLNTAAAQVVQDICNNRSSFGTANFGSHLRQMGLIDDYQYAFFPYPAPNAVQNSMIADNSFGKKKKRSRK